MISKLNSSPLNRIYLDLLQKVITNTLYDAEPDMGAPKNLVYMSRFSKHYIQGRAISLLPKIRFQNMEKLICTLIDNDIQGDFIETGVWRGGAVIYMKAILNILNIKDRAIWVADSFEGLPSTDAMKFPKQSRNALFIERFADNLEATLEEVKANFERLGLLDDQIKFLKGWFKDTLPIAPIKKLALLRLDGDYYESTMDSLINLYHKVSPGGVVIVDDYGEFTWTYCKEAVDEFRLENKITSPLVNVDGTCVYWLK